MGKSSLRCDFFKKKVASCLCMEYHEIKYALNIKCEESFFEGLQQNISQNS